MPGNKFANSEKCPKSEAGSKNQTPPHQQQQLPASSAIQIVSPFVSADIKDALPGAACNVKQSGGRPRTDGIGGYASEHYRISIPKDIYSDLSFIESTAKGRQLINNENVHLVATMVVEDMYPRLTGGLIIPPGAGMDYDDHPTLRNPVPSDLYPGVTSVPVPKPTLTYGLPAFTTVKISGRKLVFAGGDNLFRGIFIDFNDYHKWRHFVITTIFEVEAMKQQKYATCVSEAQSQKKQEPRHRSQFQITSKALEYGMAIIWPSQSYASINLFRGPTGRRLGQFHLHRMGRLAAMFRKIFMDWAVKQGEMLEVPKGYDFEGIRSKIKSRMKTFMESRRERLLARIGLVTIARQREYSYRAGGQFEEERLVKNYLKSVIHVSSEGSTSPATSTSAACRSTS